MTRSPDYYLSRAIRYRLRASDPRTGPRERVYYLARLAVLRARAMREDGKSEDAWRVPLSWGLRARADYRTLGRRMFAA